jgi:uncharacterized membrane protein YedE/YeeE
MFLLASLTCGFIFGLGLLISGMVQPAKVLAFLDIFGAWDPSLAIVMGTALVVTYAGYAVVRGRGRPVLAARSLWPTAADIDGRLILGSAMSAWAGAWSGYARARPSRRWSRCRPPSSCSSSPWPPA